MLKTEAIWLGARGNLKNLANNDCSVHVGSEIIQPSTFVRDLGIYLDAELTMKHRPARAGTHHLQTGLLQLSVNRVTQSTLNVLQRVQNAAARLIFTSV